VSTDGGATWRPARLDRCDPGSCAHALSGGLALDGGAAAILSRATDSTGYVQPTRAELVAARG